MFAIGNDKTIHLTRGDIAVVTVSAADQDGAEHTFQAGDTVRLRVFEKGKHDSTVIQKDVEVGADSTSVDVPIDSEDTRFNELINKPKDYWYEIELNPDTVPQTIVGYDEGGPKLFRLYPEGV